MNAVGVGSKVTLFHEEDILWFVNLDETEHALSTDSQQNRSHSQRLINPLFLHAGNHTMKSTHHITGFYTTNPIEPLPPLYIFETKAKKNQITPLILHDVRAFVLCTVNMEQVK